MIAGQLLLVVTPGSEPGGRWFDSNPRNFVHANLGKSSGWMRSLSRKQVAALGGLWVRVPRLPPWPRQFTETKSRGPAATTPGLHPGNDGSSPSGITVPHKKIACRRHHPARRSSWSSPECSPPCQGGDRGFKSHRGRCATDTRCGTVRKLAKRRSSNLRELWVRLPTRATEIVNRVVCLTAACKAVVHEISEVDDERFNSFPTHWSCGFCYRSSARSSIGSGRQPLKLERRVRFPHGSLARACRPSGELVDTRRSERRAVEAWEFDSPLGQFVEADTNRRRWASAQRSLISSDRRVRLPDLQLAAGYANRQSGEVESLVILWVRRPPRLLDPGHGNAASGEVESHRDFCRFDVRLLGKGEDRFESRRIVLTRAAGPMGRHLACNQEIGVRLPGGPLTARNGR